MSILDDEQFVNSIKEKMLYKNFDKYISENITTVPPNQNGLFYALRIAKLFVDKSDWYWYILFSFYKQYKYHGYENFCDALQLLNIDNSPFLKNHFLDPKKLDALIQSLFAQQYFFSASMFYKWIYGQIEANLFHKLCRNMSFFSEVKTYDTDRNLSIFQIDIENAIRRIKYNKNKKQEDEIGEMVQEMMEEFERLKLENSNEEELQKNNFSTLIKYSIKDPYFTSKRYGKIVLESIEQISSMFEKPITRNEILFAFEQIFNIIFKSQESGLFNRIDFEKRIDRGSYYDNDYNKYYLSRLKTLVNF